jgi:D-beta-D-heptose 7-phosphate kinase/D-beta-D-heptose 1-phosphate adenosyltransferase
MKKVWTNGCFDILHIGHLKMLEYAKGKGDYLVVGIDSDLRVKELKGKNRPYNNENDRKAFLESIKFVDEVVIFGSKEEFEEMIITHQIDTIVVGEEYKHGTVLGSSLAHVDFFPRYENHSTSKILSSKNI